MRDVNLSPALFVCIVGCGSASASYIPSVSEHYPATTASAVMVSLDACPVDVKVIGSVLAEPSGMYEGWYMKPSDTIDQLRARAAEAGGNGICEVQFTESSGAIVMGNIGMASSGIQRARAKVFLRPASSNALTPVPSKAVSDAGAVAPNVDTLDTVFLTNGGRLRGVVFDEDPHAGVGIKLPDGATRRLKAAEVKKILYHTP
jgi:hypothetical protein